MTTPLVKLQEELAKNKLDAILISSIPNIVYLTNYSGFSEKEREAYILLVAQPQGLKHKTAGVMGYILTDGRYTQAVKTLIPDFKLIEISHKLSSVKILQNLKTKHKIKRLGVEENDLKVDEYKNLKKHSNDMYHYSGIHSLRSIKNSEEISKIEKACKLGDKTFAYILKKIKKGVSEKELACEIEIFIKKNNADISFPPIVAFGKNSAIPHHIPTHNSKLLTHNSIILLDFGVKLNNYCSDMTRTVFFGKPTLKQKRAYQTVLSAQAKAIQQLNNLTVRQSQKQINASEIDKVAREYITSKGYPTIPHSLGHGIGIEVHENPHLSLKSKDILKEGMVFSIEPGIYLPDFGGVRIEDLVVLEKKGLTAEASAKVAPRLLTHSPKQLITIIP